MVFSEGGQATRTDVYAKLQKAKTHSSFLATSPLYNSLRGPIFPATALHPLTGIYLARGGLWLAVRVVHAVEEPGFIPGPRGTREG